MNTTTNQTNKLLAIIVLAVVLLQGCTKTDLSNLYNNNNKRLANGSNLLATTPKPVNLKRINYLNGERDSLIYDVNNKLLKIITFNNNSNIVDEDTILYSPGIIAIKNRFNGNPYRYTNIYYIDQNNKLIKHLLPFSGFFEEFPDENSDNLLVTNFNYNANNLIQSIWSKIHMTNQVFFPMIMTKTYNQFVYAGNRILEYSTIKKEISDFDLSVTYTNYKNSFQYQTNPLTTAYVAKNNPIMGVINNVNYHFGIGFQSSIYLYVLGINFGAVNVTTPLSSETWIQFLNGGGTIETQHSYQISLNNISGRLDSINVLNPSTNVNNTYRFKY